MWPWRGVFGCGALCLCPPAAVHARTQTAVEGYGAFVNFGAEKDGLVHISQLSVGAAHARSLWF